MPRRPPVTKVVKDIDDVEKPAEDIKKVREEAKRRPALMRSQKKKEVGFVGPVQDIREYILKLSLFPNCVNRYDQ